MGTIGVGLSDALFTKTQQRVLGLLFGNPDRSYYANEIVRLAGSGIGAVQRELEKLAAAGIIEVRRIGNQKHYQANHQSPIFDELRGIAVKTFGIVDVLRSFLEPFTERIRAALIYGSVAKGSDTADSDIDLMIVSSDLSYADLFTVLSEAEDKLGRSVQPTVYKPAEFQRKMKGENAFLQRVMEQPVIYLIGSQDDLERARKPRKDR
ncbi:nucleotidyltransferase domain-containing protein [Candidatus Moduliflexota bacterium]